MPDAKQRKVAIFELVDVVGPAAGLPDRPIHARGTTERVVKVVEIGLDTLREGMANLVESVGEMLTAAADKAGQFRIEQVEVQCQISGNGTIGFAGTGIGLEGSSSLKLILRRRD